MGRLRRCDRVQFDRFVGRLIPEIRFRAANAGVPGPDRPVGTVVVAHRSGSFDKFSDPCSPSGTGTTPRGDPHPPRRAQIHRGQNVRAVRSCCGSAAPKANKGRCRLSISGRAPKVRKCTTVAVRLTGFIGQPGDIQYRLIFDQIHHPDRLGGVGSCLGNAAKGGAVAHCHHRDGVARSFVEQVQR